ncbi:MAG: tripartite tricarboxylate transporter TctB family protein [Pseudomonadota bacterium]
MQMSKERVGALIFLLLSVIYGYYGGQIVLHPGDELEPMTARTLPYVLSGLGIFLSIILFAKSGQSARVILSAEKYDWLPVVLLILLTLLYGLTLDWLGFLVSTTLFLMCGFWILGERRVRVLLQIAVPFVVIFWFGLTQLLDIYLAPGRLFEGF